MKIETLAIHGGYTPEPRTKAGAVPIYQTTSYAFDDTQHAADVSDLKVKGNIYTRIMNPTSDVLEQRVAEIESGVGSLALSSGMAAITYAIMTTQKRDIILLLPHSFTVTLIICLFIRFHTTVLNFAS